MPCRRGVGGGRQYCTMRSSRVCLGADSWFGYIIFNKHAGVGCGGSTGRGGEGAGGGSEEVQFPPNTGYG